MFPQDQVNTHEDRAPDAWATIAFGKVIDVTLHKPRSPGEAGWEYYAKRGYSAPQPLYMGFNNLSPFVVDMLLERERQIAQEGFQPERDDAYTEGQLLKAAAVYLLRSAGLAVLRVRNLWPWPIEWLKSDDKYRNLVKAGALLVAEAERRDRSERRAKQDQ